MKYWCTNVGRPSRSVRVLAKLGLHPAKQQSKMSSSWRWRSSLPPSQLFFMELAGNVLPVRRLSVCSQTGATCSRFYL